METPEYIEDDHIIYKWFDSGRFWGYAAVKPPVPKAKPWVSRKGPIKILLDDWKQVLAFMIWAYEDTKSETQVRWYLNEEEGLWKPWAFPQEYNTGMSAREIPERCDEEREKVGLDRKWVLGGSTHNHCNHSAWQSPTDKGNEYSQNGIHITMGNLDKIPLDIHGRVFYKGTFYDPYWCDWFQMPPGLEGLPFALEERTILYFLTDPPDVNQGFPVEWKANVIKKVYAPYTPTAGPRGWYGAGWGGASDGEAEDDANAGKAPGKTLSNRQKKALKKELGKRLAKSYNKEDLAILAEAAKQISLLTASKGITLKDLVDWTNVQPTALDADKNAAVDEFEEILHKTGADLMAVVDWIETIAATESSA